MTQLNIAINDASAEGNNEYMSYLLGRILRIILVPEPLKVEDFEEDFPDDLEFFAKLKQTQSPKVGEPPQYLPAEDMNLFFIILFIVEGIGQETVGFMSSYEATKCSQFGWSFYERIWFEMVPSWQLMHMDDFIESSTLFLREVDPFFKNCILTGDAYNKAILGYGRAITDPYYLTLNSLYHTQIVYESVVNIVYSLKDGF